VLPRWSVAVEEQLLSRPKNPEEELRWAPFEQSRDDLNVSTRAELIKKDWSAALTRREDATSTAATAIRDYLRADDSDRAQRRR
jgi:hypothetical protein